MSRLSSTVMPPLPSAFSVTLYLGRFLASGICGMIFSEVGARGLQQGVRISVLSKQLLDLDRGLALFEGIIYAASGLRSQVGPSR